MAIATITPQELAEVCKAKSIDLIDVRTPLEFQEVRLTAARNIPLDRLNPQAVMEHRLGSKDDPIYVICRSGSRGQKACESFVAAGFSRVVNVQGGTLACVAAGLPAIHGTKSISLERQVRITAGLLVLLGGVLAWFVHPGFWVLVGLMGAGLVFAGVTNTCAMGMVLAKMPWNQVKSSTC